MMVGEYSVGQDVEGSGHLLFEVQVLPFHLHEGLKKLFSHDSWSHMT